MNIACRIRCPLNITQREIPPVVGECLFRPRSAGNDASMRLKIGRRDRRFWEVAAFLLDLLEAFEGHLRDSAEHVGITTGNLVSLLKSERHLFGAVQILRKRFGQAQLK